MSLICQPSPEKIGYLLLSPSLTHPVYVLLTTTLSKRRPDFGVAQELRDESGELLRAFDQRPDAAQDPQRGAGGAAGLERPRAEADDTAGDQKVGADTG